MKYYIYLFFSIVSVNVSGQIKLDERPFQIDYPAYFSKHDIVYKSPTYDGFEGFPMGNGDLGGMIWNTKTGLLLQINKSDAFDIPNEVSASNLRSLARLEIDFNSPVFDWLYLKDFDNRLSLYNAESSFKSESPFMDVKVKSVVAVNDNIWIVECEKKHKEVFLGPASVKISLERWGSRSFASWYSGIAHDPSLGIGEAKAGITDGMIHLTEEFSSLELAVAVKVIGESSDAYQIHKRRAEIHTHPEENGHFYVAIATVTSNEDQSPLAATLEILNDLDIEQIKSIKKEHYTWWNSFWQRSFIHIPDDYIENIYYLKRYVLASSSRGMYPALFNSAIFTWNHDVRNWVTPHHWNMQQIYWGILPSGDSDLLLPYLEAYNRILPQAEEYALKRGAENAALITEPHDYLGTMVGEDWSNMANNFTPASQIAGFFWAYYKYTEDLTFLKEKAFPFMKKSASFYLQKLKWDKEQKEYFLFPAQPYEHARANELKNCITDRVMIESLFKNCIAAAEILNTDKQLVRQWTHVINNLWEPPMAPARYFYKNEWPGFNPVLPDERDTGNSKIFALGYKPDGRIYPDSTEAGDWVFHFSANTIASFPGNLVGLDQKGSPWFEACATAVKMHPYYRSAINPDPIVASRLGLGNEALKMIGNSIRRLQHFPQGMFYNLDHWFWFSRYADSLKLPEYTAMRDYVYDKRSKYNTKGNNSGMPTEPFVQFGLEPMGTIGAALNEMLLQSVVRKIRIFPAMPDAWKKEEVAFDLWAENGFRVSALRTQDGKVEPFSIYSKKGNPCVFVNPWKTKTVYVTSSSGRIVKTEDAGDDVYSFKTRAGETYCISPTEKQGRKTIKLFTGASNNEPKYFKEAVLGRARDF